MVLTGNKKKPQVTKSGPDLSRKLLYLDMLLLRWYDREDIPLLLEGKK
jgi:hypothetical protein